MQPLKRLLLLTPSPLSYSILLPWMIRRRALSSSSSSTTTTRPAHTSSSTGDDEWNDAWESAWLPEDLAGKNRAPWETDVNFPSSSSSSVVLPSDVDADTKAFVEEMDERWNERRRGAAAAAVVSVGKSQLQREPPQQGKEQQREQGHSVEQVEGNNRRGSDDDYRLRKQRIHAGLWMKEIEKMEESRLGTSKDGGDIDRLLDSCSEIFYSGNIELNETKIPSTSEFKTKPDGWETTSKTKDGNIWEITQREEDILLQEFERRIAYSKFQIASFIKSHIFSRRRPIDGWKYMIEELGPNAKRGKGSVQRLPTLADPSTQPFKEEKTAIGPNFTSLKGR